MVACFLHGSIITIWYLDQSFRATPYGFCRFLVWTKRKSVDTPKGFILCLLALPLISRLHVKEMVHGAQNDISIRAQVLCGKEFCYIHAMSSSEIVQRLIVYRHWKMGVKLNSDARHLAFLWNRSYSVLLMLVLSLLHPWPDLVARPWLSTATQCYLPIMLGMDTDNLCELYQRARACSTEFDATHKDIRGTDLLASPWRSPDLIALLCTSSNSVHARVVHRLLWCGLDDLASPLKPLC